MNLNKQNDTRFKWLCTCATIGIVVIVGLFLYRPAENDKREATDDKAPEHSYVYIDTRGTVHVDRKCSRLNYKGMKSERISIEEFLIKDSYDFCPKCVNDYEYEGLILIGSANAKTMPGVKKQYKSF